MVACAELRLMGYDFGSQRLAPLCCQPRPKYVLRISLRSHHHGCGLLTFGGVPTALPGASVRACTPVQPACVMVMVAGLEPAH